MSPEIVRLTSVPDTSPMRAFQSRHDGYPLGSVSIPVRDHMNAATVMSIITTDFSWVPSDKTVDINVVQGSILTHQRNECIERMRGDWILFVDDDMVWQPDAVRRLVEIREENDLDMVGGLCFRRSEPYQPTLFMREAADEGYYNFLETWPEEDIVEVDATGMAFMLIHKRVFEMIAGGPMPPYEMRQKGTPPPNFFRWEGSLGEDLRFCQDAKRAGAKIFVATGIPIGHVGEITIDHRTFLSRVAERDEATMAQRREINDRMGLETMTPDEAKERLGWR